MKASMLGFLAILTAVYAVFSSEAFTVDWVRAGIGIPLFVESPQDARHNNDVIVATDLNAIARLNEHGEILWRQVLSTSDTTAAGIAVVDDVLLTGGSQIHGWNTSTGQLLWWVDESVEHITPGAVVHTKKGIFRLSSTGERIPFTGQEDKSEPLACESGFLTVSEKGIIQFTSHDGVLYWTRGEGLSDVVSACFVDLPDPNKQSKDIDWTAGWWSRLQRHLSELLNYRWHSIDKLQFFGFKKYLILVTSRGSVYGLDTVNHGKIMWALHDLQATSVQSNGSFVELFTADGIQSLSWDGQLGGPIQKEQPEFDVQAEGTQVYGIRNGRKTWSFDNQAPVVALKTRSPGETANVGTLLPDGSVLYKFLNPNIVAFATYSGTNLEVVLVDGVSGRLIDSSSHQDPVIIDQSHPFNLVVGEHWIAYSYYSQDETRSFKVSVWDLYESGLPNVRKSSLDTISAFSDPGFAPKVYKETFIAPGNIKSLGLSTTRFGVSLRDIIMVFPHEVAAVPKQMLSALPLTLTYPSAQPLDRPTSFEIPPQGHLSHFYGVEGARDILVVPSNLESTYLLATYGGIDIFFSRIAPSGDFDRLASTFPKLKLVIIIASLTAVAIILSPLAKQKNISREWK